MELSPPSPQDNENQTGAEEEDCEIGREEEPSIPSGMITQHQHQPECQNQEEQETYLEL